MFAILNEKGAPKDGDAEPTNTFTHRDCSCLTPCMHCSTWFKHTPTRTRATCARTAQDSIPAVRRCHELLGEMLSVCMEGDKATFSTRIAIPAINNVYFIQNTYTQWVNRLSMCGGVQCWYSRVFQGIWPAWKSRPKTFSRCSPELPLAEALLPAEAWASSCTAAPLTFTTLYIV